MELPTFPFFVWRRHWHIRRLCFRWLLSDRDLSGIGELYIFLDTLCYLGSAFHGKNKCVQWVDFGKGNEVALCTSSRRPDWATEVSEEYFTDIVCFSPVLVADGSSFQYKIRFRWGLSMLVCRWSSTYYPWRVEWFLDFNGSVPCAVRFRTRCNSFDLFGDGPLVFLAWKISRWLTDQCRCGICLQWMMLLFRLGVVFLITVCENPMAREPIASRATISLFLNFSFMV